MKKSLMTFFVVIITFIVFAKLNIENIDGNVVINFENEKHSIQQDDVYKVIAVPSLNAEIIVENCEVSSFSKNGEFLKNKSIDGSSRVEITNSFVMRELYGYQLKLKIKEESRENVTILNKISFQIKPVDAVEIPTKISPSFLPVYRSFVDNYDSSYLRNSEIAQSRMLIITPPNLIGHLNEFTEWKNARGIATEVVSTDETGTISYQIKTYIQEYYDTEESPPDYLLLIGDVDDDFEEFPSFYTGDYNDVTDLPYTLLEGDDYFPEILVGRFSVDSFLDLDTIVSKILYYEKNPFMDETDWFHETLLIAGNYSSSLPIPSTPINVTKWLRDKMYDYGYTEIEEIYYPPTQDAYAEVTSAINEGVGFVAYRGWGDANGWHFPEFHTEGIFNFNNEKKLPVVTSIVCNTGDFANSVDPCFGEAWLRAGNPVTPKGAVIFTGPSDLHTSTKFNNAIYSGFYYGLLDEGIYTFGSALLRGKTELYNNYPLLRDPGDLVDFYYHVYNILGDPSLMMWTMTPQEITCDIADEMPVSTNFLEIELPGLNGAIVTAIKENEIFEVAVVENDLANLYFISETTGTIEITITKPNHVPFIQEIDVVSSQIDVGLFAYQTDVAVVAGENIQLIITLKNFGTETADSITAILNTDNPFVNITSNSADFGDIVAETTSIQNFQFEVLAACPNQEVIEFDLDISNGSDAKFELIVSSLIFEVSEFSSYGNNYLELGTNDLTITIENIGTVDAFDLQGILTSLSSAASVGEIIINFGDVAVGGTSNGTFPVNVSADCFIGRNVSFELNLTDDNGLMTSTILTSIVGNVDNTHPTGNDNFGYFAYDSFDLGYEETPVYQWIEIDPDEEGNGDVIFIVDDSTSTIALPFNFTYYGTEYDSISICSNGWISFIPTWETNFRNWNIPAALGPYAMVAAFWDDLIGEEIDHENDIHDRMRICHYYNQNNDTFIIEWNGCFNRFDDITVEKFEIILYDPDVYQTIDGNGEIQFNYHTINNVDSDSNYSTIGIENPTQSDGLLYTYADIYPTSATELQNEMAIKFTTDPPDDYTRILDEIIPISSFKLFNNYPNPFRISTSFSFFYPENSENPEIVILNIKGEQVKTIPVINSHQTVSWNGEDKKGKPVSSGIYFYKLKGGRYTSTKKMILMK